MGKSHKGCHWLTLLAIKQEVCLDVEGATQTLASVRADILPARRSAEPCSSLYLQHLHTHSSSTNDVRPTRDSRMRAVALLRRGTKKLISSPEMILELCFQENSFIMPCPQVFRLICSPSLPSLWHPPGFPEAGITSDTLLLGPARKDLK